MTDPLVPADVDLRDFAFMPLDVVRLRDSDLAALESPDACWAAVLLWCASWHQVPAASLPDDDAQLAQFAGYGSGPSAIKCWHRVKDAALRGFTKCDDGRLYHAVLAQKAVRAWQRHHRLRHAAIRKTLPKRIKGSRWTKVRQRILSRDGHACVQCASTLFLEVDHIVPLAEGGSNQDSNLQLLCRQCNRRKSYLQVSL